MSVLTRNSALLLALLLPAAPAVAQAPAKEQEAKLIAVLQSPADPAAKADACRELARIGTADAVPALAALLGDQRLGHMARYGLEPIPGPAVDAALRDALGKLQGLPKVGVIASLGVRRDTAAVPALAALLKDPDATVAQTAARALGAIGDAPSAEALRTALPAAAPPNRLALCEGLLRCAEAAIAAGAHDRAAALYDALRQLPDLPHQVRAAALRGTILASPQPGRALLLEALRGTDPALTAAATRIAMETKDPEVAKLLANELAKAPTDQVVILANILGVRRDPAAVPALLERAKAGDPAARVAAIRAATEIGDPAAVDSLIALLTDPDANVAQAAAAGLAGLPGGHADAAVITKLDSAAPPLRPKLVEVIRQRRIAAALPTLLKLMDDADPALRAAATGTYAELAGAADLAPLLDRLAAATDPAAIATLEKAVVAVCGAAAQPDAAAPALAAALAKAAPAAKPAVLRTLRAAGGPAALAAVTAAVKDPDKETHLAAIRALSEWQTADAVPALLDLARTSDGQVEQILGLRGCLAIAARAAVPAPERAKACREAAPLVQRDDERRLLLGALAALADPALLDLVIPCLDQPGVKQEAVATTLAIAEKRQPKQHAEVTKAALAKVLAVAADNQQAVARAKELTAAIDAGN